MKYDCVIIGAGPAGIFTAYELMLKAPDLKVLLVDKGRDIYSRNCPILTKQIEKCPQGGCKPACSITSGFGGAGAYSDGKFNITSEFGGWMNNYLDNATVEKLINYVDSINLKHGATSSITDPYTEEVKEIERLGYGHGLKLLRAKLRHLGTEQNLQILQSIYEEMKGKIDFNFGKKVSEIVVKDDRVKGVKLNGDYIEANYVVVVTGRDGSEWMKDKLDEFGVEFTNNQVDIGVRVETNDIIMEKINQHLYEGKFIFRTSVGTTVRTFCSNPSGHVVVENHSGIMLANGHAYKDEALGSNNTNFALLVSHSFAHPFNQPNEFAREVSKLANRLSNGSIIVQKYGDIKAGRRTTEKRLAEGFVNPTLATAVPGDLGLVLPYNTMKSLIEMTEALDYVTPGIASEHTLFYGVEAKFYSARPKVNEKFETKVSGLYVGGDGAGITRGLAQAGANGIWIARDIIDKTNKLI
ncbi:NAD(P)/FAD-dependent oxidoreductase [Mycoplasmatota bacterium]|nr:NAD(P)/FAD-dependent oxidoreductase [Mycoplasmatota bacterium]